MADNYTESRNRTFGIGHFITRLVLSSVVLAITAFLTPGFSISGFFPLLMAALVISLLDMLAFRILGVDASPFGRGLTGFVIAVVIIYITNFIVPGYSVSLWGAIIGAAVYGLVSAILPGRAM